MYLCLLFYLVAGSSAPAGPPEVADTPIPDSVPSVSSDEAIGWIFSSFYFFFDYNNSSDPFTLLQMLH
jgi:hypothetical protein